MFPGVCDGFGDPQYVGFDRSNFTFNGNCTYVAARDVSPTGEHTFQVSGMRNIIMFQASSVKRHVTMFQASRVVCHVTMFQPCITAYWIHVYTQQDLSSTLP